MSHRDGNASLHPSLRLGGQGCRVERNPRGDGDQERDPITDMCSVHALPADPHVPNDVLGLVRGAYRSVVVGWLMRQLLLVLADLFRTGLVGRARPGRSLWCQSSCPLPGVGADDGDGASGSGQQAWLTDPRTSGFRCTPAHGPKRARRAVDPDDHRRSDVLSVHLVPCSSSCRAEHVIQWAAPHSEVPSAQPPGEAGTSSRADAVMRLRTEPSSSPRPIRRSSTRSLLTHR